MPFQRVDVDEQRMRFVARAVSGKETMSGLCREFGISRPTGYKWRRRFEQEGSLQAVREQSRRPLHSPHQTAEEREQRVVELRQRYGWGARKLSTLLAREGIDLPRITVHRILLRRGLVAPQDRHRRLTKRFEREQPNELWQMDGKGRFLAPDGACYPLSILDDHSRYAVGLWGLRAFREEGIQRCLVATFEAAGVPQAMLMDRGVQWFCATSEHGLTRLSVWLIRQGVRLYHGRPHHPQTQGKVERFHRTLDESIRRRKPGSFREYPKALEEFRQEYNQLRPHEALEMATPATRWRASERAYQPSPPEWEYPAGAEVRRLDPQGKCWVEGRRWFVCEALAGERVRLDRIGDLIAVSYRHQFIRELDLAQQRSRVLVMSASGAAPEWDGDGLGRPPGSLPRPHPTPENGGAASTRGDTKV